MTVSPWPTGLCLLSGVPCFQPLVFVVLAAMCQEANAVEAAWRRNGRVPLALVMPVAVVDRPTNPAARLELHPPQPNPAQPQHPQPDPLAFDFCQLWGVIYSFITCGESHTVSSLGVVFCSCWMYGLTRERAGLQDCWKAGLTFFVLAMGVTFLIYCTFGFGMVVTLPLFGCFLGRNRAQLKRQLGAPVEPDCCGVDGMCGWPGFGSGNGEAGIDHREAEWTTAIGGFFCVVLAAAEAASVLTLHCASPG